MTGQELAVQLGLAVGTGAATFLATWLGLVRRLQKDLGEAKSGAAPDLSALHEALALLKQWQEQVDRRLTEGSNRFDRLELRLGETVTADSFAAYTGQTTREVSTLTEKVGKLTGILETWLHTTQGSTTRYPR